MFGRNMRVGGFFRQFEETCMALVSVWVQSFTIAICPKGHLGICLVGLLEPRIDKTLVDQWAG